MCLFDVCAKTCLPGFLPTRIGYPQIPITKSIKKLIPKYMFHGAFALSWNVIPTVFSNKIEKIKIILKSLIDDDDEIKRISNRIEKMSPNISESTDKVDQPFPFLLFDHLIDTAEYSLQLKPLPWI